MGVFVANHLGIIGRAFPCLWNPHTWVYEGICEGKPIPEGMLCECGTYYVRDGKAYPTAGVA